MAWRKLGLLFAPPTYLDWCSSHAAVPCVLDLGNGLGRVYFSGRDDQGRSTIGSFVAEWGNMPRVVDVAPTPALEPGPLGAFDDSGAMTSWILPVDQRLYLYYIGWNRGVVVPFYNTIGLAVSDDGGQTFQRVTRGPIVGRDDVDPYFTASACVLIEGGIWRMWYVSCQRWEIVDGRPKHFYNLKYCDSTDGLHWTKSGRVCLDFKSPDEYAISRPWVIVEQGRYRMWYSFRGDRYRIGYAESADGLEWTRYDDDRGLDVSATGWDSEMVEYPCLFDHRGERYMLYNGNEYGQSGIGIAVWAQ